MAIRQWLELKETKSELENVIERRNCGYILLSIFQSIKIIKLLFLYIVNKNTDEHIKWAMGVYFIDVNNCFTKIHLRFTLYINL